MNATRLKLVIEALTPPILFAALRRLMGKSRPVTSGAPPVASMFSGAYSSFEEAAASSKGYDDFAAANAAARRLSEMKTSVPATEIDGRFQQVHSAICVARDRMRKQTFSVIDIGGGSGNYFFRFRPLFSGVTVNWHVVETPTMVAACQPVAGPEVTFSTAIPAGKAFDIAFQRHLAVSS